MKMLLIFLMVSILYSGCTKTVYVKASCPKIETINRVSDANITVRDGCVCGNDTNAIFSLVHMLRKSELYYTESINEYNKKFGDK